MAVAAALAAGCGGEDDAATKRDVRATVHEFARNIAERDYAHVCRLVTKKVIRSLSRSLFHQFGSAVLHHSDA